MKVKYKYPISVFVLLIICGFVYCIRNMGICFEQTGGFRDAISFKIFQNIFPESQSANIGIVDNDRHFGINCLFWVMLLDKPPYDISIEVKDRSNTMRKCYVQKIIVDYGNDDIVTIEHDDWEGFQVSESGDCYNGRWTYYPIMRLNMNLWSIIEHNKSCAIQIKGHFIDADDNKIPFETRNYFEYEPKSWMVYTGLGAYD